MEVRPYVGVTGATTAEQVRGLVDAFPSHHPTHRFMNGILTSNSVLHGRPVKEFWAKRMPSLSLLPELFPDDERVLNLIHYASEPQWNALLQEDLLRLEECSGPNLHGFQMNVPWPHPLHLERVHKRFVSPKLFVLQIGRWSFAHEDGKLDQVVERLKRYRGLVHYILFDMSAGQGNMIDVEKAREFLNACIEAKLPYKFVVAGGLGPFTYQPVVPLLKEFPDLSTDAEGALRSLSNELFLPFATTHICRMAYHAQYGW